MSGTAPLQQVAGEERGVALRMTLALGLAGLLSGLLIVVVFELTLPLIEANRAAATKRAVLKVVPGSAALQKLVFVDGAVKPFDDSQDGPSIYAAYDSEGGFVGYAISGQGAGFQDTIRLIYGFDPRSGCIIGMDVLESKETPGLGDKIYKDAAFLANFERLVVKPEIVVVKNGTKSADHEVDGITGATISAKAVVKILNATNAVWLSRLPAPGSEPVLPPIKVKEGDK